MLCLYQTGVYGFKDLTGSFKNDKRINAYIRVSPYPPETVLFTALPILCISSPMPRIVAHPSEAKTTKSNDQRSNLFFFNLTPRTIEVSLEKTALLRSTQPTRRLNSGFCLSIHSLHSSIPCCSACSLVSNNSPSIL
jgi:hypothetical protein